MEKKVDFDDKQRIILDAIKNTNDSILINAKAGSGKTTVLVEALNLIDNDLKVLYIAYNKHIVETLKVKINGTENNHRNKHICTYHSLGYSMIRDNFGKVTIDEQKYTSKIISDLDELSDGIYGTLRKSERLKYRRNIVNLVNLSRYNLAQSVTEILNVAKYYSTTIILNEADVVYKVLEWGKKNILTIDYTDMIWLPNELNLITRKFKYDCIFVDEVQDSSPVQQELFMKCLKGGGRIFMVGDNLQCINGWCGSDVNAFNNLRKLNVSGGVKELTMDISHRCAKSICNLANEKLCMFSEQIKPDASAENGKINFNEPLATIKIGDMVLCRFTEPLVRLYIDFLKKNIKCKILGREFKKNIIDTIDDTGYENFSSDFSEKGVIPQLYYNMFSLIERIKSENGITDEIALMFPDVVSMMDSINIIETLEKSYKTKKEIEEVLENMFVSSDSEDIENKENIVTLSTIHKAKGLESDNVFLICPSMWKSPFAKSSMEMEEERNIQYVSITRAKKTFSLVQECEIAPQYGMYYVKSAQKVLEDKRKLCEELYGPIEVNGFQIKKYDKKEDNKPIAHEETKKKKMNFKRFL